MIDHRITWSALRAQASVGQYECAIAFNAHSRPRRRWEWEVRLVSQLPGEHFFKYGAVASQDSARRHVREALITRGLDIVWGRS